MCVYVKAGRAAEVQRFGFPGGTEGGSVVANRSVKGSDLIISLECCRASEGSGGAS